MEYEKVLKKILAWFKERRNWILICAVLAVISGAREWIELAGLFVMVAGLLGQWSINDPKKKLLDKVIKLVSK